jgi:prepilin-type N-terminal cleavage/methylation domain-containing protein
VTDERGFTIAETLVALAILAVTLVALYEAMGTGFRTFDRAAEVEEAVLAAQSQIDRVVALRRLPVERQGTVDGTAFAWRLSVLSRQKVAGAVESVVMRLAVAWPGNTQGVAIDRLVLIEAEQAAP